MPKVTAAGGPSNAKAGPGEPGYIAPAAAPQEHPGYGEEMHGVEATANADGTWSGEVTNDPIPGAPDPEQVTELATPAVPAAPPKRPKGAPPAYGPPETA